MKVKEVMNQAVVVEDDVNLKDAARIMIKKNIGSLIVMRKGKIIGILTNTDLLRNIEHLSKKIFDVMSRNVVAIEENDSLDEAALLMREHKIKRLPVLKKGELVGIVTSTEIITNAEDLNEEFYFE